MQLNKKKVLASKVLNVGKDRIIFMNESLSEIKEAITRRDILDLLNAGAIQIKDINGRRKTESRKHRRRTGKIKKRVYQTKKKYVKLTRKLRGTVRGLKLMKKITNDQYHNARKMIRASKFKSRKHLLESIKEL